MDARSEKQALRAVLVARILALEPGARRAEESWLSARFATLPGLIGAGTVLVYASAFPEEIDTAPMLRRVLADGRRLVLPRVERRAGRLRLFAVSDLDADLKRGTLGIPEPRLTCPELSPEAIDWVLVPGLGFDSRRYRLGRGAGHYDRLLPTLRPEVPRWALALDCQLVDALPVEPHDVPLDGIMTACRTIAQSA